MSMAKRHLCLLAAGFLFLNAWGCTDKVEPPQAQEIPAPKAKAVKVATISAAPLQGRIEYVGALTADRKVQVATEMGGTIEGLFFERGEWIKKNQIMAHISTRSMRLEVAQARAALEVARSGLEKIETGSRPEEISIARANLEREEALLQEAQNNFNRTKELHDAQVVSDSQFDAGRRALTSAQAGRRLAAEQLRLSELGPRVEDRNAAAASVLQAASVLAIAKDRLRKSILLAPSAGIAAFRQVEPGEVLSPGTVITQVVDNRHMKIRLSVAEKDIPRLTKKGRYTFSVDAMPGREFTCRLEYISPTAASATRAFAVELQVEDPDAQMADGMTVRVTFPFRIDKKIIKIPTVWLSEEAGRLGIFVVENERAVFRNTRLGAYYEQSVEIVSGLGIGETVITNPAGIRSGDLVAY